MINKKRLVKTFIELAKIDSPSGEEENFASFMAKRLVRLGGKIEQDAYGNLITKFDGKGKSLMLNAHLDTVEPGRGIKPEIQNNKIVSEGKTIVGGDAKAGISIILEAIETAYERNIQTRPLDIILTREEETSLEGAKNLDYSLVRAKEGIVFDGDEEVFKIFISSPTYYNLDVDITGRAAHAGVEPEKGISAIEIATKIISKLNLGRINPETTFNIGMINGGSVRNAVPEKTKFYGEIRSRNLKTLEKIIKETEALFNDASKAYPDAKINFELKKEFDGFYIDKNSHLITSASKILSKMGLETQLKDSGGGSDANIFCTNGIDVIIVGTGVYESHTAREYVIINQMAQSARFCLEFIRTSNV